MKINWTPNKVRVVGLHRCSRSDGGTNDFLFMKVPIEPGDLFYHPATMDDHVGYYNHSSTDNRIPESYKVVACSHPDNCKDYNLPSIEEFKQTYEIQELII